MTDIDHDEVVRRSFERQIHLFSGRDSPFAQRESGALSWVEPLGADMIVLDVACGAAHAAEPIATQVRQLVGIDLTPVLLRLGAQRLHDNGIANVLLQEGNAEDLPFVDESFDLVYCRSSLHHFADPTVAVSEMVRVCRKGGRIVLLDLVPPDASVREPFDHLHRLLDPSHVRSFVAHEVAGLLPGGIDALTYADLSTFRLPVEVAITDQSDKDEVVRLLRAELEGGSRTGFEPSEEDGKIVVSFTTCVVHGQRL
jgi:ubiquinone/menaquinone biosynthesis C-methylase UbiE